jgi:CheY-like chemotaxis protein
MNPTNPTNPPVSRKKILVVDDDRVMLTFAGKLLEREGH